MGKQVLALFIFSQVSAVVQSPAFRGQPVQAILGLLQGLGAPLGDDGLVEDLGVPAGLVGQRVHDGQHEDLAQLEEFRRRAGQVEGDGNWI